MPSDDRATPDAGPLRADARQNRARILRAALEALTASGSASLNSIAKQAGVGIGTLYRHFPTREALVLAVYREEVRQLVDAAPLLLERQPPEQALRAWMDRLARYATTKHGLADALRSASRSDHDLFAETYGPMVAALASLLDASERAGCIRPGLDPEDVLLAMGGLWHMDPDSDWRPRADRVLDLLMDALRTGAPAP